MIEIRNLNHFYGAFHALHDVNISVQQGSLVGFIGPNGAGKSTTLRILAGFLVPTSGEVVVGNVSLTEQPYEARRRIGYMPETPYLYRELRVDEYLIYVARLKGFSLQEAKEQAHTLIQNFSLQRFERTLIGNLSKGNRQRAALAQALIGNPQVLLLDEPTSALDPNSVIEIRSAIKALKGRVTVLMSSHILSEISEVCDHIVMIRDGKVDFQGSSSDLYQLHHQQMEMTLRFAQWKDEWAGLLTALPGGKLTERDGAKLKFQIVHEELFFTAFFQLVAEQRLPIRELSTYNNQLEQFFKKKAEKYETTSAHRA